METIEKEKRLTGIQAISIMKELLSEFSMNMSTIMTNANVASDLDTFVRAVEVEPEVRAIRKHLKEYGGTAETIFYEMRNMLITGFRVDEENPCDTPVAILGWILIEYNKDLTRRVCGYFDSLSNTWWCKQLSLYYTVDPKWYEISSVRK